MAGSYRHVVDNDGRLLAPEDIDGMLDNFGDVYEALREMYGMVWFLAQSVLDEMMSRAAFDGVLSEAAEDTQRARIVEEAQKNYRKGIESSPGVID